MKTLLILADGMRPDALERCEAAQRILKNSVYTLEAQTVMPSVTLPCHVSLFYGVEPARHGTTTNVYAPQVRPIDGICDVLKAQKKTSAFFYSWGELRDLCRPASLGYSLYLNGWTVGQDTVCDQLTDRTIELLNSADVDFTFLYFGYPDVAGHLQGWMGEDYEKSIDRCWENIERLLPALKDEYAVIITADHGGHDRCHGTALPEDMTIPLIFTGGAKELVGDLTGATILDIAPTVAGLVGVDANEEWEGRSLLK